MTHGGFNENLETASHLSSAGEKKKCGEKEVQAVDSLERMSETVLGFREAKEESKMHTILKVCTYNEL